MHQQTVSDDGRALPSLFGSAVGLARSKTISIETFLAAASTGHDRSCRSRGWSTRSGAPLGSAARSPIWTGREW